jgi:hypothetical protein
MQNQKTIEEIIASSIKPRNYSDILAIIYNLRKREKKDYFPQAFQKNIISSTAIGDSGTYSVFDAINSSYSRSSTMTLAGRASYAETNGATVVEKKAIGIFAWIDVNRQGSPFYLPEAKSIQCPGSQIQSNGQFSFDVPASIMQSLSLGTHYIYIDASSPDNPAVRLTASGTGTDPTNLYTYNVRSFTITA